MAHKFIVDYLYPLVPRIKNMFGNHSLYIGDKIYLATRHKEKNPLDNGIWVGTKVEHHESLQKQFPSLTNIRTYNIKKWLLLPVDAEDFEEVAIEICELIKSGDPRVGVVPKPKKKKKK